MTSLWQAQVLTLFPEMFPGTMGHSLAGKALAEGVWSLDVLDVRSFSSGKHRSVDDTPYGGGSGMVLRPDVMASAVRGAAERFGQPARKIYLSPRGQRLDQKLVQDLVAARSVLLVCGRYEGLDQRVIDAEGLEEVSLGDFVLAGGEVAALALMEACVRLLPGVMGNETAANEESFADGLLEYPQFTKPSIWEGWEVPEVLVSGHHEKVKIWRREQAEKITSERRPDLWESYQQAMKAAKKEK
jgi:tRNA (guanine37-N1)-methyltransferase